MPILLPFIVLDQNALSRDALLQPAIKEARAGGLKLMLTDAAVIELVEGADWERRFRAGLARLAPVPELVTFARSVPDLIRMEAATGRPAYDDIEDPELRSGIRALLTETQLRKGPTLDYMRSQIQGTKARILPQYLNGAANKTKIARYVDLFKDQFGGSERRKLADPIYRREQLSGTAWTDMIARILANIGFSNPLGVARGNSIQVQNIFAEMLVAMRWYRDSGIEGADEDKLTNDLMDAEYVVIASYCHGFASEDGRARSLWEDLAAIAAQRARKYTDVAAS